MKSKSIFLTYLKITHLHYSTLNISRCYGSSVSKNPYEVLGVKSDCSAQEVKQAYIKLCKKLHPDTSPGDLTRHKKFVELNDAYTTLGNAENRRHFHHQESDWKHAGHPREEDKKQWHEREEYWNFHQANTIHTNNQWSRTLTLAGCFILVVIGSILNYSAYSSFATNYTRNRVDEKSKKISETYKNIRNKALTGNNREKIEAMEKKWKL